MYYNLFKIYIEMFEIKKKMLSNFGALYVKKIVAPARIKKYSCIKKMSQSFAVGQHNVFLVISSLPEIIFEIDFMLSLGQNI